MKKHLLIVLLFISFALGGCFLSYEIYLDVDGQKICSVNSKGINKLSITSENDNEYYGIFWADTDRPAPTELSLVPLTKGYIIKGGWQDTLIVPKIFKLSKNTKYLIERAQGDAARSSIRVFTNKNGLLLVDSNQVK